MHVKRNLTACKIVPGMLQRSEGGYEMEPCLVRLLQSPSNLLRVFGLREKFAEGSDSSYLVQLLE